MTAISPHRFVKVMGNGVVDMEKKIALKNMGVMLDVQGKLYHYLSSVMMVMIQHQYAIIFIQLQKEILLVKDLIWMFARMTCKLGWPRL